MPRIKVYSTSTCPVCHQLKAFLELNHVPYEDVDVQRDQRAAQEMVRKTHQMGVPVIEIDGQLIVGFDETRIRAILNL